MVVYASVLVMPVFDQEKQTHLEIARPKETEAPHLLPSIYEDPALLRANTSTTLSDNDFMAAAQEFDIVKKSGDREGDSLKPESRPRRLGRGAAYLAAAVLATMATTEIANLLGNAEHAPWAHHNTPTRTQGS